MLVRTQQELRAFRKERQRRCCDGRGAGGDDATERVAAAAAPCHCPLTAALLGVEGLLALELTPHHRLLDAEARLRQLHAAGFRLLGLNHFVECATIHPYIIIRSSAPPSAAPWAPRPLGADAACVGPSWRERVSAAPCARSTAVSGSAHGEAPATRGLSPLGRQLIPGIDCGSCGVGARGCDAYSLFM